MEKEGYRNIRKVNTGYRKGKRKKVYRKNREGKKGYR